MQATPRTRVTVVPSPAKCEPNSRSICSRKDSSSRASRLCSRRTSLRSQPSHTPRKSSRCPTSLPTSNPSTIPLSTNRRLRSIRSVNSKIETECERYRRTMCMIVVHRPVWRPTAMIALTRARRSSTRYRATASKMASVARTQQRRICRRRMNSSRPCPRRAPSNRA